MNPVGRLHVITDIVLQSRYSHVELARLAVQGGADVIQYREKDAPTNKMIETARQLKAVCAGADACLIINDRIDVALASGADGVHLGQGDFPIDKARQMLGPHKVIGGSADDLDQALAVQALGADYVGLGPIFPTGSKADAGPVLGLDRLAEVCRSLNIPVVAIGGLGPANVGQVIDAGCHGIAVISAVCCQEDPYSAAGVLAAAVGL